MKFFEWFVKPNVQVGMAIAIIITSIVGWPLSALTVAKDEPFVILSISWLALIYAGYSALVASMADKHIQEQNKKKRRG